MTVSNTTSWAPNIPTETIDALVLSYLRNAVVVTPMVRTVNLANVPGLKHDFNSFGALTAATKTQGTDFTPAELTIAEDGTVTAAEVGVAIQLPWIVREASPNISDADLARELGNAVAAHMETAICAQFQDFTTTKGTTGVALAVADIEDALLALRQAKAPTGPQQDSNLPPEFAGYRIVLAESGVAQLQRSIRQAGYGVGTPNYTAMLQAYGTAGAGAARYNFLGVDVFGQDLVATTGGDRNGAIFCPAAIGLVTKRAPRLDMQKWMLGTEDHHVASAVYGTDSIKLAFGVELLHVA